jgi:hypothetical protein
LILLVVLSFDFLTGKKLNEMKEERGKSKALSKDPNTNPNEKQRKEEQGPPPNLDHQQGPPNLNQQGPPHTQGRQAGVGGGAHLIDPNFMPPLTLPFGTTHSSSASSFHSESHSSSSFSSSSSSSSSSSNSMQMEYSAGSSSTAIFEIYDTIQFARSLAAAIFDLGETRALSQLKPKSSKHALDS